jgi:hypothetical protein
LKKPNSNAQGYNTSSSCKRKFFTSTKAARGNKFFKYDEKRGKTTFNFLKNIDTVRLSLSKAASILTMTLYSVGFDKPLRRSDQPDIYAAIIIVSFMTQDLLFA